MLFLTGNASDGKFAVAEKTVVDRCGMTEGTYKKARAALVEKGWIIHNKGKNGECGEIIVDYEAIYKSEEGNTEDTSANITEYTPMGNTENTYNNISSNRIKENKITIESPKETSWTDENGNFKF